MDYVAFLSSPLGLILMVAACGAVGVWIFLKGPGGKRESVLVLERVKPHISTLWLGKQWKPKNPGELQLMLPDKRKFTIAEEAKSDYEAIYDHKKKRWVKLWPLENGNLVKFGNRFGVNGSPIMDAETVSRVLNRDFFRRLSEALKGNTGYMMLVMGAIVGISIGWILYPSFNHPPPIFEFCTRLQNGTVIPRSCPG